MFDYQAKLAIYDQLIAGYPEFERKGKKNAYTAMNGNMFSFLDPNGALCFRFSKDDLAAIQTEYGLGPVLQYGSVMRGYAEMPDALLEDESKLATWFAKCVENARSLPEKPTKKKA